MGTENESTTGYLFVIKEYYTWKQCETLMLNPANLKKTESTGI
jgi:hypothetical protein